MLTNLTKHQFSDQSSERNGAKDHENTVKKLQWLIIM